MPYIPPFGGSVTLSLAAPQRAPSGADANLEFSAIAAQIRQAGGFGGHNRIGVPGAKLRAQYLRPQSLAPPITSAPSAYKDIPRIQPAGIQLGGVGAPAAKWRQIVSPEAILEPTSPRSADRVRLLGGYSPPPALSTVLNWAGDLYAPPPGLNAILEFGALGYGYIRPVMGDTSVFGAPQLSTPKPLAPFGFSATLYGLAELQASLRSLRVDGIPAPQLGAAAISNAAQALRPSSWVSLQHGTHQVQASIRQIFATGGTSALAFGAASIFLRDHYATPGALLADGYGTQRVEHYRRALQGPGFTQASYGSAVVSLRSRSLSPVGLYQDFASNHMVGGLRILRPVGFDATRFGARIVPELQAIYPLPFTGVFGGALAWNYRQVANPAGFATGGTQPADRWGFAHAFNLRQYVIQFFDPDSELNPPPWPLWTAIENRNHTLATFGHLSARFGNTEIANRATAILPAPIAAPSLPLDYQAGLVGYRVRYLPVAGVEPPYLGGWLSVVNDARLLQPQGFTGQLFGVSALANTRRYFPLQGWDSAWFGYAMVAFGIRAIELGGFNTIGPPPISLPEAKLHTRHIEHVGINATAVGGHYLSIHRTIIATRWTHRDLFGEPVARNLTPELVTGGRASDEFGDVRIRLQWRPIATSETFSQIIPRPIIAYRDRGFPVQGINSMMVSDKLTVTKTGAPPYTEQTISLRGSVDPLTGAEGNGKGIEVDPKLQVPEPTMNQCVLYTKSEDPATLWGMARVTSNVIRINYSYNNLTAVAEPRVEARIRYIVLTHPEDDYAIKAPYEDARDPAHRMSPFTIYAMTEAPAQALDNHPNITSRPLHVIDGRRTGGADIQWGNARVNNQHRALPLQGIPWVHDPAVNNPIVMPRPLVVNARAVVTPAGINYLRMGRASVPGTVELSFYLPFLATLFGTGKVAYGPPRGNQTRTIGGFNFTEYGNTQVQHKNRIVLAAGFLAELLGTRLAGDRPYMWQGLRVGPLMPTIPSGYRADVYGAAFVAHRVREARINGFDSLAIGYDIDNFAARMRVTRHETEKYPSRRIVTQGHSSARFGYHDARLLRQYIRPDGNADQHRKGAF